MSEEGLVLSWVTHSLESHWLGQNCGRKDSFTQPAFDSLDGSVLCLETVRRPFGL